jgi:hypothetical protein
MSQELTIRLTDETYADLKSRAETVGIPLAEFAAQQMERRVPIPPANENGNGPKAVVDLQAARERFLKLCGSLRSWDHLSHNEQIDFDVAREYQYGGNE